MNKFKVGDKLKLINDIGVTYFGNIGDYVTVIGYNKFHDTINVRWHNEKVVQLLLDFGNPDLN